MRGFLQRLQSLKNRPVVVVLLTLFAAASASGQSGDVNFPTPVLSDSVSGTITPRDIGDARLTRHFYTFNSAEGDLLITVESTNLNGDVDLFTAVTLRPLAKVTLYAGSSPTRATKSVYLRRAETLVLRVEGRTAIDADATYTIRFAGAFAPAANTGTQPEVVTVPTLPSVGVDRNARRASAVGARLEEPRTETPATETAETVAPTETPAAAPSEATTPAEAAPAKPKPRRRVRVRPPPRTARTRTPTAEETTAGGSGAETSSESATTANPSESPARTTTTPRRRNPRNRASASRRNETTTAAESPGTPAPAQASSRLVIENRDGTRIERDMSGVRRVTVENGMIVIVSRDGKTARQPMADVLRMSIEPQLQNAP